MRKLFFWMPLVLVGSLVYWTLAVTLGGMSLWAVWPSSSGSDGPDGAENDIYQPITVKLIELETPDGLFDGNDPAREPDPRADPRARSKTPSKTLSKTLWTRANRTSAELASRRTAVVPPSLGPSQGPGDTAF